MAANRGEIAIRVFRRRMSWASGPWRSIRTRTGSPHRLKADEAYQVGKPGEPIRSYLNIEAIVELAQEKEVDAIHPGYGFLSENAEFARACARAGIAFVGPAPGPARPAGRQGGRAKLAREAGVPVLSGSDTPVVPGPEAHALAEALGYPVIVKASMGGAAGACGSSSARRARPRARPGSPRGQHAFGCPDVFLEKFIRRAKHIEVQLLGDHHGHLVHLYERDCSVQRRHQKIIEIAPAFSLDPSLRRTICDAAQKIGPQASTGTPAPSNSSSTPKPPVLLHRGQPRASRSSTPSPN